MSITPPNIVRGSGVVTREQIAEEQRKASIAAEQEAQRQRELAKQEIKRRRSPSRRAKRAAEEAAAKAAAEAKEQRKAQRDEDFAISIGAFREAEAKGEKEGIDVTSAKVKIRRDTGEVTLSAKGTPTAKAKRKAQRDAETEAAFETFRALDKEAGGRISQLKTKSRQLPTGETSLRVSGYETEGLSRNQRKNIQRLGEGAIFTEAKARRKDQIGEALEGARPEYRTAINAALIREEKKAKPGEMFDEPSLKQYVSDLNYSFDVAKGRGAADDVYYSPVSGKPGLFEGFGTYGDRRTVLIPKRETKTTFTFEQPKDDGKIGLPDDPIEAFKAPFENIAESVSFSVKDLFGGREIQRTTYDTKTGEIVRQTGIPKYKAEVEGALYGDLINYGSQRFGELTSPKRSALEFTPAKAPSFSQVLFNFGEKVKGEKPESVAASLTASAILTVPDLLTGGTSKLARSAPKFVSPLLKGSKRAGTADTFAQQSKDARIAMGLEAEGKAAKGGLFGKAPKVKDVKFSKISDADFQRIQSARSPTSRFRFFVNYEPKKQLAEIGRGFDFGESGIRRGALLDDEVTIVKEFERAPVGRFAIERRPSVFGQVKPLSIEEELDLVRLRPDKPGRLPSLAQIAKPEAPTPVKLAEGAPIKFADQSGLPKLADIVKPDVPSKPSFAGFPAVRLLPKYTDIIKESKSAPRSFAGFPAVRKLPKLGDISKKEARTPETPFTFGTVRKLPKLGDILKPGKGKGKGRRQRSLSASDVSDLLDTLEGKKAIEPARNLLTRSEQGALAGDILEGLTGGSRAAKKAKKVTTLSDIDKAIRDQAKGAADFGGKVVKSGRGSSLILEPAKTKKIAPPSAPKKGSSRDIFGNKEGKGAQKWVNALIPKVRTGKKEKASSRQSTDTVAKALFGTSTIQRTKPANLLGFRQRSKESVLQFPKVDTISIPRSRTRTKVKVDSAFKMDFGIKAISLGKTTTRQRRSEIFPTPSRTRTRLIPDIPGLRTPRITGLKKPPAGGRAKAKGKKPKGGRFQLRSFVVKDVLSATLGTENKFAKDFEKTFGELY